MSGVGVMRLLGWNGRTGDPVVIAYHGPGTADGSMLAAGVNELLPVDVESVGLYELGPTGARTLVRPVDGIAAIDVADSVLAGGLTRPGDPPWAPSPWLVVAVVLGAIGVLALAGLFVARRRRRIPT